MGWSPPLRVGRESVPCVSGELELDNQTHCGGGCPGPAHGAESTQLIIHKMAAPPSLIYRFPSNKYPIIMKRNEPKTEIFLSPETEKFLWRWEEKVKCPQICVPCIGIPPMKEEVEQEEERYEGEATTGTSTLSLDTDQKRLQQSKRKNFRTNS